MYIIKRNVSFSECDSAGIMFFSRVFEICHSVYESYLHSTNDYNKIFCNPNYAFPIKNCSSEFISPILLGEEITIEMTCEKNDEYSYYTRYRICDSNGKEKAVIGIEHRCVSKVTLKSVATPPKIDNIFETIIKKKRT